MAIPRLDRCPKCKGRLLLEKDNYGLYQQCLQCGYLHDLQTFPILAIEETQDNEESIATNHKYAKRSGVVSQDTARLIENSPITALADTLDSQLILDALHKRHRNQA